MFLPPSQFYLDSNWIILSHNETASDIFACDGGPLIGRDLRDVIVAYAPGAKAVFDRELLALLREGAILARSSDDSAGILRLSGMELPGAPQRFMLVVEQVGNFCPDVDGVTKACASEPELEAIPVGQFLPLLGATAYRQDKDFQRTDVWGAVPKFATGSKRFIDRVHVDDQAVLREAAAKCLHEGQGVRVEYRLYSEDGLLYYLVDFRRVIRSEEGRVIGYHGFWLDITSQVLSERRLQQAVWRENLSLALGVLLHDFNNVITGMFVLLDSVEADAAFEGENAECLASIRERMDPIGDLLKRIKSLNKKKTGRPCLCAPDVILREQEDLLRSCLRRGVQFTIDMEEGEYVAHLDVVALQTILLSFATNSRGALSCGDSCVILRVRRVDLGTYLERGTVFCSATKEGEGLEIAFCDDGCGIAAETLPRLVEQNYSTKGHDAGLGLFHVRQLAEANGLGFSAVSESGAGTEMIIIVPLVGDGKRNGEVSIDDRAYTCAPV